MYYREELVLVWRNWVEIVYTMFTVIHLPAKGKWKSMAIILQISWFAGNSPEFYKSLTENCIELETYVFPLSRILLVFAVQGVSLQFQYCPCLKTACFIFFNTWLLTSRRCSDYFPVLGEILTVLFCLFVQLDRF